MKFTASQIYYFFQHRNTRRNVGILLRFVGVLAMLVVFFSTVFHYIMAYELRLGLRDQEESWITGFYWTLTVMSTLGFGDITFYSDLGRVFSITVLLSGIVFLLVLLPFTFIQFFYAPWVESQASARAPKSLHPKTSGHVILTRYGSVTRTLIRKLNQFGHPYVLLVDDLQEALQLHDEGISVVHGAKDDPRTYERIRAVNASLLATTCHDTVNANVVMTLRQVAEKLPVVATVEDGASIDILELAGASHVVQLHDLLGKSLARRVSGSDSLVHEVGRFDRLVISEATLSGTSLVGQVLKDSGIREATGLNVVGLWHQGLFTQPLPETKLDTGTVLVLAGSKEQMDHFNDHYMPKNIGDGHVIIIGAGRVGRAVERALKERGINYVIVEQEKSLAKHLKNCVTGSAAELSVLEAAGIQKTSSVIVTTRDDDTNIYLTLYCRRLRPDVQIISRATGERNVRTVHRAGANLVMSYASMGANTIFNLLRSEGLFMVGEGLDVFRIPTPKKLLGLNLIQAGIRAKTGCSVVAIQSNGKMNINPDPRNPIPHPSDMVLLGEIEAEQRFMKMFS